MYKYRIDKTPDKYLSKLSGKMYRSISEKLLSLQDNPFPTGCGPVEGIPNTYKFRAGGYRIIYEVDKEEMIVTIKDIDSRGDIYKRY